MALAVDRHADQNFLPVESVYGELPSVPPAVSDSVPGAVYTGVLEETFATVPPVFAPSVITSVCVLVVHVIVDFVAVVLPLNVAVALT